jgi:hypothetical protein
LLRFTTRLLLIGFVFTILYQGVSRLLALEADGEMHAMVEQLFYEMQRSEALQQRGREQAECMNAKTSIIEDYIAGRLTLREAAEQFGAADAIVKNESVGLVASYFAPETEQGLCQEVEAWTKAALLTGHTPQEVEEVRCRLEEELNELLSTPHPVN